MRREAHRVDAVKDETGFPDGLCRVHMQAAFGVILQNRRYFRNGLNRTELAVHRAYGYQHGILSQEFPQVGEVCLPVASDV